MEINWRQNQRFTLRVPLWVRPMDAPESAAHHTESSNISSTGICFVSDLPLSVGSPVEILFKMPMEVLGGPVKAVCCRGKVVRIGDPQPPCATRVIAVQFQYYEVVRDFSEATEAPQHDFRKGFPCKPLAN